MGKYPEIEEKMEKRINGYAGELKTIRAGPVSYTHLDVYKRQSKWYWSTERKIRSRGTYHYSKGA